MTDPNPGDPNAPDSSMGAPAEPAMPPAAPPAAPPPPMTASAPATPAATTGAGAAAARPTGITILAVLAAIGGVLGLFAGFVVFLGGTVLFGSAGGLLGLAVLAFAALSIAFSSGASNMLPWAWPLGVVIAAGNIILAIVYIIGGASIVSEIVTIVLYGVVLYYLNQPQIRALFGR